MPKPPTAIPLDLTFDNPYDIRDRRPDGQKLTACIPGPEYRLLKRIFPILPGLSDKLISNLVKLFIDYLKQHELDNGPIDPAWTIDHPTYNLFYDFLGDCRRGLIAGSGRPRHDARATDGVCETFESAQTELSDPASNHGSRRHEAGCGAQDDQEENRLGLRSDSTAHAALSTHKMTALEQLAMLGVGE